MWWGEQFELEVGDLCVYVGAQDYSALTPRIIYEVVEKREDVNGRITLNKNIYQFKVAFDPNNPTNRTSSATISKSGTRGMKKLTLTELCFIRLQFDDFIRTWAKSKSG